MQPTQRSRFYIFLDIDGVILDRPNDLYKNLPPGASEYANRHVQHLEKRPNHFSNNYGAIIAAHYCCPQALSNLDTLIQAIDKVAQPVIIMSSNWREKRTVEELKEIYFGMHSFAKYIEDKTPEKGWQYDRGQEIQEWLQNNPQATNFCILDDRDGGISKLFKERFIHVDCDKLLTQADVTRAAALIR